MTHVHVLRCLPPFSHTVMSSSETVHHPTHHLFQYHRSSFLCCAQCLDSSTLRDEHFTSEVSTPTDGKRMWIYKANVQAIVHRRHGKWHDGERFPAECLMTLVLHGQLPHSVDAELKSDQLHDDVNLVHRSYVTYPNIINADKVTPSFTTRFITKVISFGPIFGPITDLNTRTHDRNYTNYL